MFEWLNKLSQGELEELWEVLDSRHRSGELITAISEMVEKGNPEFFTPPEKRKLKGE